MLLTVDDIKVFAPTIDDAKAAAMVVDTIARAARFAPCLLEPENLSDSQKAAVKAILRDVVLRWNDVGTGARVTHSNQASTGPYSVNQSQTVEATSRVRFWPSEIAELQAICADAGPVVKKAFSVDLSGTPTTLEPAWWNPLTP